MPLDVAPVPMHPLWCSPESELLCHNLSSFRTTGLVHPSGCVLCMALEHLCVLTPSLALHGYRIACSGEFGHLIVP